MSGLLDPTQLLYADDDNFLLGDLGMSGEKDIDALLGSSKLLPEENTMNVMETSVGSKIITPNYEQHDIPPFSDGCSPTTSANPESGSTTPLDMDKAKENTKRKQSSSRGKPSSRKRKRDTVKVESTVNPFIQNSPLSLPIDVPNSSFNTYPSMQQSQVGASVQNPYMSMQVPQTVPSTGMTQITTGIKQETYTIANNFPQQQILNGARGLPNSKQPMNAYGVTQPIQQAQYANSYNPVKSLPTLAPNPNPTSNRSFYQTNDAMRRASTIRAESTSNLTDSGFSPRYPAGPDLQGRRNSWSENNPLMSYGGVKSVEEGQGGLPSNSGDGGKSSSDSSPTFPSSTQQYGGRGRKGIDFPANSQRGSIDLSGYFPTSRSESLSAPQIMGRSTARSSRYLRDTQLLLHLMGHTEPFGVAVVDGRLDKLDYVRKIVEKHFSKVIGAKPFFFLSKDGVVIRTSQEKEILAFPQAYEKLWRHHTFDDTRVRYHLFIVLEEQTNVVDGCIIAQQPNVPSVN